MKDSDKSSSINLNKHVLIFICSNHIFLSLFCYICEGGGQTPEHNPAHSSAVVAMDKEGNVCSMIHTINSLPWGTGLFVEGIALPHSASIFKANVKNTKPGGRLVSELQPSIVFRRVDEKKQEISDQKKLTREIEDAKIPSSTTMDFWKPAIAVAVVGKSLREVTPQLITSLLDQQINPDQALSCPQFMLPSLRSYYQDIQVQRYTIDENVLSEVCKKGQPVKEIDDLTAKMSYGLGVILTVGQDGTRYAASTPYLDGIAEGEEL